MNAELALGTVAIIIALWGGIIITVRGATPAERFVGVLILAFGLFLLVRQKRQRRPSSGRGRSRMRCPDCGSHDLNYIDSMNRWMCSKCHRMFS